MNKRIIKPVYDPSVHKARIIFIAIMLLLIALTLVWRVVDIRISNQDFLQGKSNARVLRDIEIPAHRGMITDRNGEPLAISTPVVSVWVNPSEFLSNDVKEINKLADLLKRNRAALVRKIKAKKNRTFVYLKRRIPPQHGEKIKKLNLAGVFFQEEYRRFYPAAETAGHVIGFTNIDDKGIEGIELIYDDVLTGKPGQKSVVINRLGQIVSIDDAQINPKPGQNLQLSLDRRIQYLAYAELKNTIAKHQAKGGSVVVLDINSGEVLAMVNQPGYNPNKQSDRKAAHYKNRAVTDQFEPGSTIKPFTIMAALESKRYSPYTLVETGNGSFTIGGKTVFDTRAHNTLNVTTVLQKSSNVGTAKIALNLPEEMLWDTFASFGFGIDTGSLFYGETSGRLLKPQSISKVELATISYGYGLSVSAIQLAQAYATMARYGKKIPVSFLKLDKSPRVLGTASIKEENIKKVIHMMEGVVKKGGTAPQADIPGYRVAGKTGTAKKSSRKGGYTEKKYTASFVGFAPVSKPEVVVVAVIDEPSRNGYYGGVVAGPLFKSVMSDALRLSNISPDALKKNTRVKSVKDQIIKKLNKQSLASQKVES